VAGLYPDELAATFASSGSMNIWRKSGKALSTVETTSPGRSLIHSLPSSGPLKNRVRPHKPPVGVSLGSGIETAVVEGSILSMRSGEMVNLMGVRLTGHSDSTCTARPTNAGMKSESAAHPAYSVWFPIITLWGVGLSCSPKKLIMSPSSLIPK